MVVFDIQGMLDLICMEYKCDGIVQCKAADH